MEDFSLYLMHQEMGVGPFGLFIWDNSLYYTVCVL